MNDQQEHAIDALLRVTQKLIADGQALSTVVATFGEHPATDKINTHFLGSMLQIVAMQTQIVAEIGSRLDVLTEAVDNMRRDDFPNREDN